jgi:hypothetical protein
VRRLPSAAGLVALAVLVLLPCAAQAEVKAGTVTAASGGVRATLSWRAGEFGARAARLTVARAGATRFDAAPSSDCEDSCLYLPSGARRSPLQVSDLDSDGEPEVLADVFTGGAHCCAKTELLRFTNDAYAVTEIEWGNGGYDLRDLNGDGRPEFVSGDDAFAAAFTAYAASFSPPRVLDYDASAPGALRDVTRSYPTLARTNGQRALRELRRAKRQGGETLGFAAAYVADLYLQRRGKDVGPWLASARRRGDLRSIDGPAARSFERRLLAFLKKHGYR